MISSKMVNRIFVAAFVAMPVLPVLFDYVGPSTYARWLLADAANQYDRGEVEQAQLALQRAYSLSPDISSDPNFWKQIERIEFDPDNPSKSGKLWTDMVRRIENPEQRAAVVALISELLSNRKQFKSSVALLAEFLPPKNDRAPVQNNQIAYMRSLAGEDLETALSEIDEALKGEDNEAFLDTKAWVLHGLGRSEEALPVIDRSLKMLMAKWRANSLLEPMITAMEEIELELAPKGEVNAKEMDLVAEPTTGEPTEPTEDNAIKPAPPRDRGWAQRQLMEEFSVIARAMPDITEVLATLRYHRMKILESLSGHEDEAARELRWLEAFSTKALDELI